MSLLNAIKKGMTHWESFWLLGLLLLILSTLIFGQDASAIHIESPLAEAFKAPYWLGTDDLGRDVLARLTQGAALSLGLGLASGLLAVGFGAGVGVLAALKGGWIETLLMRLIEVLYGLPGLLVVILLSVFLEPALETGLTQSGLEAGFWPKLGALTLALVLFNWPDTARLLRGETHRLLSEPFVEAYTSLGGGPWRLVFRQLLPNLMPLLVVALTLTLPRVILAEATLSFLGLGIQPPLSSWGTLASDGWYLVRVAPALLLWPTLSLSVTLLALNRLASRLISN